ncbi:MAG TPA: FAD-dependent thymidylate synthase, partial [Planctomycetaceae bacterium]
VERLGGPAVKTEWRKRPRVPWNKLTVAKLVRVESFEFVGVRETYDIEVEGPHHNFVANGIVTHNSVNEYSTRYSIAIDAAQATPPDEWRGQAASNRQGSEGMLPADVGERLTAAEAALQAESRRVYEERLAAGVAREQARKDLPLSTYTEAYWKIDLHNLLHFLALRMDAHAQKEIRDYATAIGERIVRPLFPVVWEAFEDYRLNGMSLTRLDAGVIARLAASGAAPPYSEEAFLAAQDETWRDLTRSRERDECRAKLVRLGLMK